MLISLLLYYPIMYISTTTAFSVMANQYDINMLYVIPLSQARSIILCLNLWFFQNGPESFSYYFFMLQKSKKKLPLMHTLLETSICGGFLSQVKLLLWYNLAVHFTSLTMKNDKMENMQWIFYLRTLHSQFWLLTSKTRKLCKTMVKVIIVAAFF